jgi:hypothetical protein
MIVYVVVTMIVAVMMREGRLKRVLMPQTDLNIASENISVLIGKGYLTTQQNESDREKMLTFVISLTLSPSRVEAPMELALGSCFIVVNHLKHFRALIFKDLHYFPSLSLST